MLYRNLFFILIVLTSQFLHAQINQLDKYGRKQGLWRDTSIMKMTDRYGVPSEKEVYAIREYKDDKIHGICISLADNGIDTLSISHYTDGARNGLYTTFKNGKIYTLDTITNGNFNGHGRTYHPNGKIMVAFYRQNGLQHGLQYNYDENGLLTRIEDYHNGINVGFQTFYQSGRIEYDTDVMAVGNVKYEVEKYYDDDEKHTLISEKSYINRGVLGFDEENEGRDITKKKSRCKFLKFLKRK
jgi:antitoxin component YwqK of YwqJK toxin-antitoxin module